MDFEVAELVGFEPLGEEVGVGFVSDGDEDSVDGHLLLRAVGGGLEGDGVDFSVGGHVAVDVDDVGVPEDFDFGVFEDALLHDFAGAEGVSSVDDVDFAGVSGEVVGLFHGGVAASDDDDFFASEEEAVACGAGGYSESAEGFFAFEAEPFGGRAGADDDGFGLVSVVADLDLEGFGVEVDFGDGLVVDDGSEPFGLFLEEGHHVGAHDTVGEAGIVFDVGRDHELSAWFGSGEDDGGEVGAGGVESGGVAGGAGSDDDNLMDHDFGKEVTSGRVRIRGGGRG